MDDPLAILASIDFPLGFELAEGESLIVSYNEWPGDWAATQTLNWHGIEVYALCYDPIGDTVHLKVSDAARAAEVL